MLQYKLPVSAGRLPLEIRPEKNDPSPEFQACQEHLSLKPSDTKSARVIRVVISRFQPSSTKLPPVISSRHHSKPPPGQIGSTWKRVVETQWTG